MSADPDPPRRLWRARRRHDAIDAVLVPTGDAVALRFIRNGRPLVTWTFDSLEEAATEAGARLRSLQRAGWVDHW